MCGIAGILNFEQKTASLDEIKAMTDRMAHRGPDDGSYLVEGPIAFGHRRLSIIDLSTDANQPFTDASGRYTMVFNGEMYNYQEVKMLLGDYPFRTSSDTEVLIAAFAKWGPLCVRYFKGMFAFAVWDRKDETLTVVRDRLGVKPLYYYYDDKGFVFASEQRSVLASGRLAPRLDKQALTSFLSYQSFGSPLSAIENLCQLEAGSWLQVNTHKVLNKELYWNIVVTGKKRIDPDPVAIKKEIRRLMLKSVERRLVADVPVGAFLSGGIDSSAVVGLMAEAGVSAPNTFNIRFNEPAFDESEYANLVAKKFNTEHTSILLEPGNFLDELENALNAMDIPSADGVNTYVVSKAIRKAGITVALSGVGGDELFAGYPFFNQFTRLQKAEKFYKRGAILRNLAALFLLGSSNRKSRMRQVLTAPAPDIEYMYPVSRQILSPVLVKRLTGFHEFSMQKTTLFQELHAKSKLIGSFPKLSHVSIADYLGYTRDTLLKDTDQMSMAVSLETREPFFDHELIEYVLSVPDEIKTPVYPKSLLVESLQPLLPDAIVHRPKKGFLFPWSEWMKKELKSFCEQRLFRMAERSFINGGQLKEYWKRFLRNDPSVRWSEIWIFVVLEHWMETNGINE